VLSGIANWPDVGKIVSADNGSVDVFQQIESALVVELAMFRVIAHFEGRDELEVHGHIFLVAEHQVYM